MRTRKINTISFESLCPQYGTFLPSDVKALQSIFDFVKAERHNVDPADANALGRAIIRLYRQGYRDPAQIRDLLQVGTQSAPLPMVGRNSF